MLDPILYLVANTTTLTDGATATTPVVVSSATPTSIAAATSIPSGSGPRPPSDVLTDLDWTNVAVAASLLLLNVILSFLFRLGLEFTIIISAVRCLVQLSVMGQVLEPVFRNGNNPVVVFSMTAVLLLLGSAEAFTKSKYSYPGMHLVVLLSMFLAGSITTFIGMTLAIRPDPWYTAQVYIPTVGMILGNSISGIALGIRSCLTAFKEHGDVTEVRLAFGASRWEAARPVVRESLRTALLPPLNNLAVMGLISIPGQMTGQILAGAPIESAVHFQQIVMYMIVSSTALGTLLSILMTTFVILDSSHQMRLDRITSDPLWITQWLADWYWSMWSRIACWNPKPRAPRAGTPAATAAAARRIRRITEEEEAAQGLLVEDDEDVEEDEEIGQASGATEARWKRVAAGGSGS
ncbi:hypothetical protein BCR44DRAFT_156710 [Catenaria anguillulae PL171]|uniref:Uncharacterized protein n=1 Tax=Catenaria anguillulae PL171 TaxID=765915 RepID=A0A1Y2HLH9_9FUNG|nr:hypothetical protein BCR44DRAFT_156710 [Catenaria anguillulae PL171]